MPILKKTDRSIGVVMERLADPKRRHLVRPEDKEAAEKIEKTMQAIARLTIEPIITGPGLAALDHMWDMVERLSPTMNMISQNILPAVRQAVEAHTHFEELSKSMVSPLVDIRSWGMPAFTPNQELDTQQLIKETLRESQKEQDAVVTIEPVLPNNHTPQLVQVINFDQLEPFIDQAVARREKSTLVRHSSTPRLVEFVLTPNGGYLQMFDYPRILFSEKPARIIDFFYNAEHRKQWQSPTPLCADLHCKTEYVRKTIEDINQRVLKATEGTISEIIASRQRGLAFNSPKEYRWAL